MYAPAESPILKEKDEWKFSASSTFAYSWPMKIFHYCYCPNAWWQLSQNCRKTEKNSHSSPKEQKHKGRQMESDEKLKWNSKKILDALTASNSR